LSKKIIKNMQCQNHKRTFALQVIYETDN
jgi:hypothetical protein